jgi:hypothetical protein
MREPTLAELADPPLPDGPPRELWHGYLRAWSNGPRRTALAAVAEFVDALAGAPREVSDGFAEWVCHLVFDRDELLRSGQWGGAMRYEAGAYRRPVTPALTTHLLSARVVLPYLLAALPAERGPRPRWLHQFAVGQGYRLPPGERRRLFAAIEDHRGPGAEPAALPSRAHDDPIARRRTRRG